MAKYIYQNPDWPNFFWDSEKLLTLLTEVRNRQGRIVGKMSALGFELKNQANLEILTQDVLNSNEIEGETLDKNQVRSSIARRLGLEVSGLVASDRNVDSVVEVMIDATKNFDKPLTKERVLGWHNTLFPSGYSGMYKIQVGKFRDGNSGPMEVISGPFGKEKVHFQAPSAELLENEMNLFLTWFNGEQKIDLVIKSALAHLWFVTLHPFDDGNGRIARALADMILARSDGQSFRFYSMSSQIKIERKKYFEALEKTQKSSLDISDWLEWFLSCLLNAIKASESILEKIVFKHDFWLKNSSKLENERQQKMINMLLDGFEGKLTSSKWAKICKCSQDTALRDIKALLEKQILKKLTGGSRSTAYDLF
ncbi:MAG: Fic family protein [Candidatus Rifleibacteriota bacterium]